mgnify:CR=1 FL=1
MTASACASRMPDRTMRPPGRTWRESAGARDISGFARMLATTTSNASVAESPSTGRKVASTPLRVAFARLAVSACGSMSVPTTRPAPKPAGGDRQDSRAASEIENRLAGAQFAREPAEAKPRRRMRPGPERESRIEREIDGGGIDQRHTTMERSTARRRSGAARTAPASRAPSPVRARRRSRAAATLGRAPPSRASAAESPSRRRTAPSIGSPANAGPAVRRARRTSALRPRCRRCASAMSTDSAPASSSASAHASAASASGVEAQRNVAHHLCCDGKRTTIARRRATRSSRPACAWRASLRDSGSTSRRAGISRRAGAPDAAECWS